MALAQPLVLPASPQPARQKQVAQRHVYEPDVLPTRPPVPSELSAPIKPRRLGANTTLFVNFDGVDLDECNPSNSKRDCTWYNFERPIKAFSGSIQTKYAVLQAMRRDVENYGIRVTGQRPQSGDYTMIIYGGEEGYFGMLGSAPPGDCDNERPNQIGFAHLDGPLKEWVNGGANTALHEAAHSWGLDHIDDETLVMFPSAGNEISYFGDRCDRVISDADGTLGESLCPELNIADCGSAEMQDSNARLRRLFGPPYVDLFPPSVELSEPRDGQYFQAPASFTVVLTTIDDLHPQAYTVASWLGDGPRPQGQLLIEPGFRVIDLPVGEWSFHVVVTDEADNETRLDFDIVVGLDPPPDPAEPDAGCACTASSGGVSGSLLASLCLLPLLVRRRQR